jgi:hypothetical protein
VAPQGSQGGAGHQGRVAGDSSEVCLQGSGGPWHASHPQDPPGSTHSRRHIGGSGHHLGTPMGGLRLRP